MSAYVTTRNALFLAQQRIRERDEEIRKNAASSPTPHNLALLGCLDGLGEARDVVTRLVAEVDAAERKAFDARSCICNGAEADGPLDACAHPKAVRS